MAISHPRRSADNEITNLIKPFALSADWAHQMLERVKDENKRAAQSTTRLVEQKRKEIEALDSRLQILLDSLLDRLIDRETFIAQKAKLMSQKKTFGSATSSVESRRHQLARTVPEMDFNR